MSTADAAVLGGTRAGSTAWGSDYTDSMLQGNKTAPSTLDWRI
jgi:hypothetical protein